MNILMLLVITLLTACGSQAQPLKVFVQPSDRVVAAPGYAAMVQPLQEPNVALSVWKQSQLPGPVILWVGAKQDRAQTIANFPATISEATKYPGKFPYVYLYDEAGWCDTGICYWTDEDVVLQGAALARSVGIKTIITILPDVILDPRFALKDINAFDDISIDVYPSIRPTTPNLSGCRFSDNLLENLFFCSVSKLRQLGFTGQIGYIYQAFGLHSEPPGVLRSKLELQRQAINNAAAMGADAVMPWGLYLGAPEIAREPDLFQLGGTEYEGLVTP